MFRFSVLDNINIISEQALSTPEQIKKEINLSDKLKEAICLDRLEISRIIQQKDKRLLVICGPCSIHDIKGALDYAERLAALRKKYAKTLNIVMRSYFEKPRTTIGWKGYINDPHLDGSFDIEYGLRKARSLLKSLAEMGLPLGTEALDPISPQYISEFISWSAIGARTSESQTHREMASGLSMPVGFKNGTDGSVTAALNGIKAASKSQVFMGINQRGQVVLLTTRGNLDGHLILRGGSQPNYDETSIREAVHAMEAQNQMPSIIVDCSHENSKKDHRQQPLVAEHVLKQRRDGNESIIGIMLESNLYEGNQSSTIPKHEMKYGVSVTDSCMSWETTEGVLAMCHDYMK
ncbi:3-deoxy-7-phosphoheptulonate synthase [Legionella sp. CNM-4043-24]|uniref:3-deoxy-7-phosphoheptulonate synthase n=1 Tax=Legionella sp. CNM-4043-24 TaxID=3421646 RepID=UPI00403B2CE1